MRKVSATALTEIDGRARLPLLSSRRAPLQEDVYNVLLWQVTRLSLELMEAFHS